MKRFYKVVTVDKTAEGFQICLDGKPVKTPAKRSLYVQSKVLADEIMQEWSRQGDKIIPDTMPVTQLIVTMNDRVSELRSAIEAETLKYLDTDLVCYRADIPEVVFEKQKSVWNPLLDWFTGQYGVSLEVTTNVSALSQPPEAHEAIKKYISALDDTKFTVLQFLTSASGSLVLALAFVEGHLDRDRLLKAMFVEEDHKAEIYNESLHGHAPDDEIRRKKLVCDFDACEKILSSCV